MKKNTYYWPLLLLLPACFNFWSKPKEIYMKEINTINELQQLFPQSVSEIKNLADHAIKQAQESISKIIAIQDKDRTFDNTARALDTAAGHFSRAVSLLSNTVFLNPEIKMREEAQKQEIRLGQEAVDIFNQNKELYDAFKAYVEGNAKREKLSKEEKYFLEETMKDFERSGLNLPEETRNKIKKIQKELTELTSEYDKNINDDESTIEVTKEKLEGVDEDFIESLKKTDDGLYILGIDYPTYFTVMKTAKNPETRKKLYHAFQNRAYPVNIALLEKIVEKRDELAKLLGFKSYADLDLEAQMVKIPKHAKEFLDNLLDKAREKALLEIETIYKELPEGIEKTKEGKIKPWDQAYVIDQFKKKHYDIDEEKLREYFPMEKTINALLDIYQQFFNLNFKESSISGMWHEDLKLIEVYKNDELIGYIILDLYPRPNKYSHAAAQAIIPALLKNGKRNIAVAVVMANFPPSTEKKPSLLKRSDVSTFFHEFGHAIHAILGATELAGQAGYNVKMDFVELPSQILEEWLYDKDILKKVSHHYKTGESLPDDIIKKLIELKQLGTGNYILGQGLYALYSLDLFKDGKEKDSLKLYKNLHEQILPFVEFYAENHLPASFGHLTGYGAKYYGYLWSKVFALDLFEQIKKAGLLNPKIGTVYAEKVLMPGGSKDPNEILRDFLGREPSIEPFLRDMGLEKEA